MLTKRRLIELLEADDSPDDTPISIEGCDCTGWAVGVTPASEFTALDGRPRLIDALLIVRT